MVGDGGTELDGGALDRGGSTIIGGLVTFRSGLTAVVSLTDETLPWMDRQKP